jgi:hypothetical protein
VGHIRGVAAAIAVAVLVGVAAGCASPPPNPGNASFAINPSHTDALISSDNVSTHFAWVPNGSPRGKLAVVFPGTSASTLGFSELANLLRNVGYHVIVLRYPSSLGTQGACPDEGAAAYPDCFRHFRSEIVFGSTVLDPDGLVRDHPIASVDGPNSVVNRLTKLLDHLVELYPSAGWGQYQHRTSAGVCTQQDTTYGGCKVDWTKVAAVGHSQGAGVGLYLSKFFPLDRVVMLSGSFDAYVLPGGGYTVAPWITEGGFEVPRSDIRVLLHLSDPALPRMRAVAAALAIPGAETNVANVGPPYGGSKRLVTSIVSACALVDSQPSHNSTAVDLCVPDGAYDQAWNYLVSVD